MASIEYLLNPISSSSRERSPTPTSLSPATVASRSPRQKRRKLVKDQPSFKRGNLRGDLRYPPHEERDEELERVHTQFHLHPLRNIANFPAHIPYCSQKKSFKGRTGRGSLEVFHYTFQIPNGDGKKWVISWDYNIGLVRTTSLFKCTQHPKTAPAKALKMNPGLGKISHSITGGALIGQGYWMPFEAAKALAATFCWKIRYVLTPIFGLDFPSRCIHPEDTRFGDMRIDPAIILQATREATYYRGLEVAASPHSQDCHRDRQYVRHIFPKSSPNLDPEDYCISPGTSPVRSIPVKTPQRTGTGLSYAALPGSMHDEFNTWVMGSDPSLSESYIEDDGHDDDSDVEDGSYIEDEEQTYEGEDGSRDRDENCLSSPTSCYPSITPKIETRSCSPTYTFQSTVSDLDMEQTMLAAYALVRLRNAGKRLEKNPESSKRPLKGNGMKRRRASF
ncbi:hypothetical protein BO94DRAFT_279492 [Aspergillus sclerotioniger CBS 115572]|uniref:HTH APSES-type domain-containing protein n=1 Tax=Aspergillus sclerotioniger CBS 115572 TaxID=1450535 RepID=A0A317X7L9_9EURO|nr:hypothetical protein BO94DRAFT_279492 [Aspergillus sclerotioniger CBS 115572]PWY94603.1 hypothetical protein BO94DRAFT_279492 [Aspergillus sclerotioniger CBS 115572]